MKARLASDFSPPESCSTSDGLPHGARLDDEAPGEWVGGVFEGDLALPAGAELAIDLLEVRVDLNDDLRELLALPALDLADQRDEFGLLRGQAAGLGPELIEPGLLGVVLFDGSEVDRAHRLELFGQGSDFPLQFVDRDRFLVR